MPVRFVNKLGRTFLPGSLEKPGNFVPYHTNKAIVILAGVILSDRHSEVDLGHNTQTFASDIIVRPGFES